MSGATILYILGWLISAFGFATFVPMGVALLYSEPQFWAFLATASLSIFVGISLVLLFHTKNIRLTHRDGFLITVLTLCIYGLLGAAPLYLTGIAPSVTDAVFEAVSGLTTTGATVLVGLDHMAKSILFWRAWLQFLGGIGIVVLGVAILPFLKVGGMQLFKADSYKIERDKLQLRVQEVARSVWVVYLLLTIFCAMGYAIAGMNGFDAITHAFTTVSTGGFANYDASFGYFNNPAIEIVAIVVMLLAAMNFMVHFSALHRGGLKAYWHYAEGKSLLIYATALVALFALILTATGTYNFIDSLRYVAFNTVSLMTTTGFVSTDYNLWPTFITGSLVLVMLIGACTSSTAGGLRMLRVHLLLKLGGRELYRLSHPHSVAHIRLGQNIVPSEVLHSITSYAGLYLIVYVISALLVGLSGTDMVTAFSAAAGMVSNAGPGLASVGPATNYAGLSDFGTWVCTFTMIIGRVDVLAFLILFTPHFWRK